MNTRKLRKAILTLCSALLLVSLSVGITLAYLVDDDAVTNTFTVGKVAIELDEAPVDEDGKATTGDRVKENAYQLFPGHTYDKDPTIEVDAESEDCFLYVIVENGLEEIEVKEADNSEYKTIAAQMTELGWDLVDGTENVYYALNTDGTNVFSAGDKVKVFENFTITGDVSEETLAQYKTVLDEETGEIVEGTTLIVVTAYAIQADGFDGDAEAAWVANSGTSTKFF